MFLANLTGIAVASLLVFLVQRYGSVSHCWRNLLVWLGLLGLLCIPLGSSLHDFSVRQDLEAEFGKIKAGQIKRLKIAQKNPRLWSRVRLIYSSVRVTGNKATVDLVVNAPEDLLDEPAIRKMQANMLNRSRQLGLDDIKFSLSVVPNRVYRFELGSDLKR